MPRSLPSLSSKFSPTFVKEQNVLRYSVYLVASKIFSLWILWTFVYWPAFWIMLFIFVNIWSYKIALWRKNPGTNDTLAQSSFWKLIVFDDILYFSSIIFITFVVCRSMILRRYSLFTTTQTSPSLRTRRSVCYREYSRCSRAHLQARDGHVRRWVMIVLDIFSLIWKGFPQS